MEIFFQQDDEPQHTANVVLDVLHMFGSHVLSNRFPERFEYV